MGVTSGQGRNRGIGNGSGCRKIRIADAKNDHVLAAPFGRLCRVVNVPRGDCATTDVINSR